MFEDKEFQKALGVALHLLQARDRLESEIRDRLSQRGFLPETTAKVLEHLRSLQYVDDKRTLHKSVENRARYRNHGKKKIYYDLLRRGADPVLLEQELEHISPEDQLQSALELLQKRYKPEEKSEKILRFLFSRGFESEIAYQALNDFKAPSE
jgi:regulatory protein